MRQWLVQLTAGFLGRCGLDYDGAVRSFDDILSVKWRGQTFAESEKKARNNLGYQFRKHMGLSQSVPIRLTGKMTVC